MRIWYAHLFVEMPWQIELPDSPTLRRNRAALDAYNRHVEKHGVFSEGLRSF